MTAPGERSAVSSPRSGVGALHAAAAFAVAALLAWRSSGDALFASVPEDGVSLSRILSGFAAVAIPFAAVAAFVAADVRRNGGATGWFPRGSLPRAVRAALVFVLPVAFCCAAVSLAANFAVFALDGTVLPPQRIGELVADPAAPAAVRAFIACAALLEAPLLEEIVFRGILYKGLRTVSSGAFAAFVSSFMFAACHGTASAIAPLFCFGLFQAWLARRTGSIAAPVALHAAYNLLGVSLLVAARAVAG